MQPHHPFQYGSAGASQCQHSPPEYEIEAENKRITCYNNEKN